MVEKETRIMHFPEEEPDICLIGFPVWCHFKLLKEKQNCTVVFVFAKKREAETGFCYIPRDSLVGGECPVSFL